jgi:hypothetical protein
LGRRRKGRGGRSEESSLAFGFGVLVRMYERRSEGFSLHLGWSFLYEIPPLLFINMTWTRQDEMISTIAHNAHVPHHQHIKQKDHIIIQKAESYTNNSPLPCPLIPHHYASDFFKTKTQYTHAQHICMPRRRKRKDVQNISYSSRLRVVKGSFCHKNSKNVVTKKGERKK